MMEKEENKKLDPQVETDTQAVTEQELTEEELDSVAGGNVLDHYDEDLEDLTAEEENFYRTHLNGRSDEIYEKPLNSMFPHP